MKKNVKRIATLVIAVIVCFAICSCGDSKSKQPAKEAQEKREQAEKSDKAVLNEIESQIQNIITDYEADYETDYSRLLKLGEKMVVSWNNSGLISTGNEKFDEKVNGIFGTDTEYVCSKVDSSKFAYVEIECVEENSGYEINVSFK